MADRLLLTISSIFKDSLRSVQASPPARSALPPQARSKPLQSNLSFERTQSTPLSALHSAGITKAQHVDSLRTESLSLWSFSYFDVVIKYSRLLGFAMDPLSTLASIFTLCDWAFKVLRVVKTAHNAPKEINSLVDEVSGLKAVIGCATSVIQDPHSRHALDSSQLSGLNTAIDDVNSKLHNLCKTVEYCSRKTSTGRFLLLRRINKIKSQRLELNDAKSNLIIALEAINL